MQNVGRKIQHFTDLIVWQEAHKLVISIYDMSNNFPPEEKFSLTSQIRRAAVSITSNIAEGFGRQTDKDKLHFYTMTRGSILELQNQLIIARDISILKNDKYKVLLNQAEIAHKLLNGLIKSIKNV